MELIEKIFNELKDLTLAECQKRLEDALHIQLSNSAMTQEVSGDNEALYIPFDVIRDGVELEFKRDLQEIQNLELPEFNEIENFNPLDEIYKETAKPIREKLNLPEDENQIIYIIMIENGITQEMFQNLLSDLENIKDVDHDGYKQITSFTEKGRESFQVNKDNVVVYVGSSKSFASRVRQHVGHDSKTTATIMLRKWKHVREGEMKIRFGYFNFGKNVSPEVVKRIEFQISNILNPLIGANRRS